MPRMAVTGDKQAVLAFWLFPVTVLLSSKNSLMSELYRETKKPSRFLVLKTKFLIKSCDLWFSCRPGTFKRYCCVPASVPALLTERKTQLFTEY